jgi:hypothetical protein
VHGVISDEIGGYFAAGRAVKDNGRRIGVKPKFDRASLNHAALLLSLSCGKRITPL